MLANIYKISTSDIALFNDFDIIFKNIPRCIEIEKYDNDTSCVHITNIYIIDALYDIKKELGEFYNKFKSIDLEKTIEINSLHYNNMYKLSMDYKTGDYILCID